MFICVYLWLFPPPVPNAKCLVPSYAHKEAQGWESLGFGYQENSWVRLRRALRHDYPDLPTDWYPWASSGRGCADSRGPDRSGPRKGFNRRTIPSMYFRGKKVLDTRTLLPSAKCLVPSCSASKEIP